MANLMGAPSLKNAARFLGGKPGQVEGVRQTLYHFQNYPLGGANALTFFQTTAGQAAGGLEDTNMQVAGTLPAPQAFLCTSIEIYFFPTVPVSYVPAAAAALVGVNDTYNVLRSGFLRFALMSKDMVTEAPLMRFPPKARLEVNMAYSDQTTPAADLFAKAGYASGTGAIYRLDPAVTIGTSQNFSVVLGWNTAVALTAGTQARIGVVMDGITYRQG